MSCISSDIIYNNTGAHLKRLTVKYYLDSLILYKCSRSFQQIMDMGLNTYLHRYKIKARVMQWKIDFHSFRLARSTDFLAGWNCSPWVLFFFQFQLYMNLLVGFYQDLSKLDILLKKVILTSSRWNQQTHILLQI